MNHSFLLGIFVCFLFARAESTNSTDCDAALPSKACKGLENIEKDLKSLSTKAVVLVSKAVEEAAKKNAVLFVKTIELIRDAKPNPADGTNITKLIEDVQKRFTKIGNARSRFAKKAVVSIQEAATKIFILIDNIIVEAANSNNTDIKQLKEKMKASAGAAYYKIRYITLNTIQKVQRGNRRIERYVVNVLEKLGIPQANAAVSFVDQVSAKEEVEIADATEKEMEADISNITDEAYELIASSRSGNVKRGVLQDFWNRIKAKLVALKDIILNEIKKAIAIMWPQIKDKLNEIVQIILNTANQAIVSIVGQMILVTAPGSLL